MRRPAFVAAVSWIASALLHGTSLVFLGALQGGPVAPGRSDRQAFEVVLTFASDEPRQTAVQLASFQEWQPAEQVAAPELLATAPPLAPAPAEAAPPPKESPPDRAPAAAAFVETQLFGVRGRGKRFAYVFDRSASMEGAPLAAAKRELLASLAALTPANQFQVVFYNDRPLPMPRPRGAAALTAADELGKRQAAHFAGSIFAEGGTDHVAALQLALALRPDVLFLLTDANEPRLSPAQLAAVRRLNRQTTIHTIEFGSGPAPGVGNFLQELAMENGGQHTYIDVTQLRSHVR